MTQELMSQPDTFRSTLYQSRNIRNDKPFGIFQVNDSEDPVSRIRTEFEPKGIPVYPISAVSGDGLRELLYAVQNQLDGMMKVHTF